MWVWALALIAGGLVTAAWPVQLQADLRMHGFTTDASVVFKLMPFLNYQVAFHMDLKNGIPQCLWRKGRSHWQVVFPKPKKPLSEAQQASRARIRKAIWGFADGLHPLVFCYESIVGTGDAAATAQCCGIQKAALLAILARVQHEFQSPPQIRVQPEFSKICWMLTAKCILRYRLGQGILIGILIGYEGLKGKVQAQWINIRSKTSCERPWKTSGI